MSEQMKVVGDNLHTALHRLLKGYCVVQEHYGFKPEQSPLVIESMAALKEWCQLSEKSTTQP